MFADLVDAGFSRALAAMVAEPELVPEAAEETAAAWERDAVVEARQRELMGGEWRTLTSQQRMVYALRKHYNQIAFFVATGNWGEATGAELTKLNVGRDVLEKAGATLPKLDPAAEVWARAGLTAPDPKGKGAH